MTHTQSQMNLTEMQLVKHDTRAGLKVCARA